MLAAHDWGGMVRMALHTGVADERDGDYFGPALNRVARLRDAGHGGQILLSAVTVGLVRDQIPDGVQLRDLGEHRLRDLIEPQHVFQAAVWGLPADFPPLRTEDARPTNLPSPLTSFVGREREIDEVARLLETARLVTLTGPGGAGKTRLALSVAETLQAAYPDGVWFVDLSPLTEPGLVVSAIAQVLGVREVEGAPPAAVLQAFVRERHLLLVLDNFEQVAEAAALVRDLLVAARGLTVLATSRVALRLQGEREYAVPPLPVPDTVQDAPLDAIARVPSVRLFVERARAARYDFALTVGDAAAVAEICVRLDGLPLAIELAAARVKVLPPAALRARLDQRLALLGSGARGVPHRQRTLRDTIRWSYDLLAEPERVLFRRLAVFVGGCTIAAAEAVCAGDAVDAFAGLTSLVDHSLVRRVDGPEGEPRFGMMETVREFARERLAESGEEARLSARHAAHFAGMAEEAERAVGESWERRWDDRLDADHGNFRAALAWLLRQPSVTAALALAAGLAPFWRRRGHLTEGRQWLEQALAGANGAPAHLRARGLVAAGELAHMSGAYDDALARYEAALPLFRAADDASGQARVLRRQGMITRHRGDPARARALLEKALSLHRAAGDERGKADTLLELAGLARLGGDQERFGALSEAALPLYRRIGDAGGVAEALNNLGILARDRGALDRAVNLHEEVLAIQRHLGDAHGVAAGLLNLGVTLQFRREFDRADALLDESVRLWRGLGDKSAVAGALVTRGILLSTQRQADRALPLLTEALAIDQEIGHRQGLATCITAIAVMLPLRGEHERAARLFGAGEAHLERMGATMPPAYRPLYQRAIAAVRAALGEAVFASSYAAGRALSLDEAVALALEQTTAASEAS
jgi:predicted ATPase